MRKASLDGFDRKLLRVIQRDAGLTAEALGEIIGLSASAAQRRLRRLKADGIIVATLAVVDAARVDQATGFIVGLEIERERPELLGQLRAWLAAEEQIQQAYYVTGTADFILVVTSPDTASYDALMSRLLAENTNVRRFTTNVVLGGVKRGLFVPIPAGAD